MADTLWAVLGVLVISVTGILLACDLMQYERKDKHKD
jgi:hypothetical protein